MRQHTLSLSTDQPDWLPILDIVATSTAAALWIIFPQIGFWPLVLVITPWILRFWQTGRLAIANPLAAPIWLFMLTALFGLWAAYNSPAAWAKFWLLLVSFFLFYALANQPFANLWFVARLLSVSCVIIGVYFLLTHDWQTNPIYIGVLDNLAQSWMGIRPFINFPALDANKTAGLITVLVPFSLALTIHDWRDWPLTARLGVGAAAALVVFALILTGSRAAWFALAVALSIWAWSIISRQLAKKSGRKQPTIFWLGIGLAFVVGAIILFFIPASPISLANLLPGAASADSRAAIYNNTLFLLGDFPFVGGGLDSFAGLYSQYVLIIPQKVFTYAHNVYLDVALEQGLFGLLAFIVIMAGSFWLLGRSSSQANKSENQPLLRWAIVAGLIVMLVHGLFDDAIYGNRATPLLWLFPGLAVALSKDRFKRDSKLSSSQWGVVALVLFLAVFGNFLRPQWQAAWIANIGAIQMARVELADWPTNEWDDGRTLPELQSAKQLFNRALQIDPANRTVHHRLGMIAMLERDFETAVNHLETAYHIDENHTGIYKTLAFSYLWAGQPDKAQTLFANISEAQDELKVYVWWWETQGRDDLATQAENMLTLFE